jgi:GT2 family glycosyltransferase
VEKEKLCSIYLPVWNELSYTQQCMDTLLRHTNYPFELIVINNGSSDGTTQYLKNLNPNTPYIRDYKIITNIYNLGTTKAGNQGLRAANGDFISHISNDIIFEENWLSELIGYLEKNPKSGAVCPYTLLGGDQGTYPERKQKHLEETKGEPSQGLLAACYVMTREVVEIVGYYDEQFEVSSWEDVDYYWRMLRSGFKPECLHKVVLYHYGMITRRHFKGDYEKENHKKFCKKYDLPLPEDGLI